MPISPVRPVRTALAAVLTRYPTRSAASRIRCRVASATWGLPANARDTVAWLTPASAATSLTVTAMESPFHLRQNDPASPHTFAAHVCRLACIANLSRGEMGLSRTFLGRISGPAKPCPLGQQLQKSSFHKPLYVNDVRLQFGKSRSANSSGLRIRRSDSRMKMACVTIRTDSVGPSASCAGLSQAWTSRHIDSANVSRLQRPNGSAVAVDEEIGDFGRQGRRLGPPRFAGLLARRLVAGFGDLGPDLRTATGSPEIGSNRLQRTLKWTDDDSVKLELHQPVGQGSSLTLAPAGRADHGPPSSNPPWRSHWIHRAAQSIASWPPTVQNERHDARPSRRRARRVPAMRLSLRQ